MATAWYRSRRGYDPLTEEAVKGLVDQRLTEIKKEEQKKKDAAEQGYEVGSDLSLKFSLKDGLFPWLETPTKTSRCT